jgi:hypothetical protein
VARKVRRSHGQQPVQGRGSRLESACGVLRRFTTKLSGYLVEPQDKTGGSAGGDGIRARLEASMLADMWREHRACVGRTRTAAKAWSCDKEE